MRTVLPWLLMATALCAAEPRNEWYRHSLVNLHFDNHSGLLGKDLGVDALSRMLGTVPSSMFQVSAQSNGYATYPTEVGLVNPGAEGYDTLATFREVARRTHQRMCVYMSVDRRPIDLKQHPEWQQIDAAGKPVVSGEPIVCQRPNAAKQGYLYERFLPQIREIARKYDPAGFWFDGDYILTRPCWCPRCVAEWKAATGQEPPRDASAPTWNRWLAWHLERYAEYRRLVGEAIHTASPTAMYTSNWSFAWTPEAIPGYIDTLSGDVWSIRQVQAVTQRWGAQQAAPWDIMSYCTPDPRSLRREYSLQRTLQEGGLGMASGGNWFVWAFNGNDVPPYSIQVARFCAQYARDREAALAPSVSLSQVAVLDSELAWRHGGPSGMDTPVHNVARALAEARYLADVVNDQALLAGWTPYRVVIVPDAREVAPVTLAKLAAFVDGGGTLLLTGGALWSEQGEPAGWAERLGLKRTAPTAPATGLVDLGGKRLPVPNAWTAEAAGATVLAKLTDGRPALTVKPSGRGQVAWLAAGTGAYPDDGLVAEALRKLGLGPSWRLDNGGDAALIATLRRQPGRVVLHLVDLSARVDGRPVDVDAGEYTDFNPPRRHLKVTLPWTAALPKVTAVPDGTKVTASTEPGKLVLSVDPLQTHAAVILDTDAVPPLPLLPADDPRAADVFHPDPAPGVLLSEDFEGYAPGAAPARPWASEVRGETKIRVTGETAASGKQSLELVETAGSSFWPFLHRNVGPLRHGEYRLAFDLRLDPGVTCLLEPRNEGRGAGPAVSLTGDGPLQAAGKTLAPLPAKTWLHVQVDFRLGEHANYDLTVTAPNHPPQTFRDLPYATEWFYVCNALYWVGSGEQPGVFGLDNVVLERR